MVSMTVSEEDQGFTMGVDAQVVSGSEVTETEVKAWDSEVLQQAKAYTVEQVPSEVGAYIAAHKEELKGDRGERGLPGEPGERGEDGQSGADGSNGLSAYQIACEQGFVGTIGEWLVTLIGERGARGDRGLQGEPGEPGQRGLTGEPGVKGDPGERGLPGEKGEPGERGADGAAGEDGYSPVRGTDYWTDEDMETIRQEVEACIIWGAW